MGLSNAVAMLLMDLPARRIVFLLPPLAMLYTLIIALCTSFAAVALLQLGIPAAGGQYGGHFLHVRASRQRPGGGAVPGRGHEPPKAGGLRHYFGGGAAGDGGREKKAPQKLALGPEG